MNLQNAKLRISVALVVAFALVVGVAVLVDRSRAEPMQLADSASAPVVRENSHRLDTAPDGRVTLVEFLDFECESCLAAFPVVEELREAYRGRVTFVARYFPIPSHANSFNAALAVESAAQQGEFEAMYRKMYETQATWGEQQASKTALFHDFAQELGLDLTAYDKAAADPATRQRIEQDIADAEALGVTGTPTFFLNGQKIEPKSAADFKRMIDDALAG